MVLAAARPRVASAPLLSVEALTVRFDAFSALDAVDFTIGQGEAVALAGENGAGKSTLVRCIGGDIAPTSGQILIAGQRIGSNPAAAARRGVAVVWQDLALCNNLDVASNLLLGRERGHLLRSDTHAHGAARQLLESLGIPLRDTTRNVGSLSGGERQLLAIAKAMWGRPQLLILDEPTGALGINESAKVEQLATNVREQGTTVLLVSHDIEQMFRLADRITVLRHGRVVADVDPKSSQPEDVVALISGQQTDSSARRQLSRLHGLADRLASSDASSSLPLILSALSGALGAAQLCIHLLEGERLRAAGDLGLPPALMEAWAELPIGVAGGPVGLVAAGEDIVVDHDIRSSPAWARWRPLAADAAMSSSWSVPVIGTDGLIGVITVFRESRGGPPRHEVELVTLYCGYVASAVERERLLGEVTARNRALETIQEVLETLAGPVPLTEGLIVVLQALCEGLQADAVGLLSESGSGVAAQSWAAVEAGGDEAMLLSQPLRELAEESLAGTRSDGKAHRVAGKDGGSYLVVSFAAPDGASALIAFWAQRVAGVDGTALMEDAANSLRLARERQESERARQEASALRRSQELQRGFLSRLSHELRTPLTAIGGYASSLMAPDVTWDGASEKRFVSRIGVESARLNRLVADLLDFSAIESSTMRLQADWCDVALVLDAAIACLTPSAAELIQTFCAPDLPVVWADHDRLEQVFLNLLENALRHNPPGTRVFVEATGNETRGVLVSVSDDGEGMPEEILAALFEPQQHARGPSAGAGLGLSIAKGIVDAHEGQITLEQLRRGTRFVVHLPIGGPDSSHRYAEDHDLGDV
jgi:signal transduction histidine kinase/ABC-type multidrug transport system ATPase subunit